MEILGRLLKEPDCNFLEAASAGLEPELLGAAGTFTAGLAGLIGAKTGFLSAFTGLSSPEKTAGALGEDRVTAGFEKLISSFSEAVNSAPGGFLKNSPAGMIIMVRKTASMVTIVLSTVMVCFSLH
jgi:hypothetical protein